MIFKIKVAEDKLTLHHLEVVKNTNDLFTDVNVRVTKFNRTTHVIRGNFKLIKNIDNNLTVKGAAYGLQGNEYRRVYERLIPRFCTEMSTTDYLFPNFLQATSLPQQSPEMCPIKPGTYFITDYFCNEKPPKHFMLGIKNWKASIEFLYKRRLVYHINIYLLYN